MKRERKLEKCFSGMVVVKMQARQDMKMLEASKPTYGGGHHCALIEGGPINTPRWPPQPGSTPISDYWYR